MQHKSNENQSNYSVGFFKFIPKSITRSKEPEYLIQYWEKYYLTTWLPDLSISKKAEMMWLAKTKTDTSVKKNRELRETNIIKSSVTN